MAGSDRVADGAAAPVALVTGGSTGIGLAICHDLLARGFHVLSLALEDTPISNARLESVCVDLSDGDATRAAAADAGGRYAITTLVHNAGAIREQRIDQVSGEDLEVLTQLHVGTAITLVQAVLPAMRAARYGRIVLMSSRAVVGLPGRTVYSATKAGMIGLTRTWALELGAEGITVNAVAPGPIAGTAMFDGAIPPGDPRIEKIAAAMPVGRLGAPADVARAVRFFTEPEGAFVTGQTLFVCGGASVASMSF